MYSTNQLWLKAHQRIPGGAHTYSRGDDQFPSNAPKVLESGNGAYVYDTDKKKYLDYGMGLRSVAIGYNNERVSNAAIREILKGNNLTRVTKTEVLAAEAFCNHIPNIDMVKFTKHGSAATSAAVKLARAHTGKQIILRCLDHPFFSYDDWFISSTDVNRGIPEIISQLTKCFNYNDIESLEELFVRYKDKIAGVILEPATSVHPVKSKHGNGNFLNDVQNLCNQNGAVFILDEIITGFRWTNSSAAKLYNVQPDLTTFGKALANGFSVAAIGGKKEIMELGGINHTQERVFLASSTHGAEMNGLGAMIENIKIYNELDVSKHLWNYGSRLIKSANSLCRSHGVEDSLKFGGIDCSPTYSTLNIEGQNDLGLRTLLNQEMIKNGVIFSWLSISYCHGEAELDLTLEALDKSLAIYKKSLSEGCNNYLQGPIIKPVFRKFN